MEPTLDEIKNYILNNNIDLEKIDRQEKILSVFGNTENLKYYDFYLNHSDEVNDWLLDIKEDEL